MYHKALKPGDKYPPGIYHGTFFATRKPFYLAKVELQNVEDKTREYTWTYSFPLASWEDGEAVFDLLHCEAQTRPVPLGSYNGELYDQYQYALENDRKPAYAETILKEGLRNGYIARYHASDTSGLKKVKTGSKLKHFDNPYDKQFKTKSYVFEGYYRPDYQPTRGGVGKEIFTTKQKVVSLEELNRFHQEASYLRGLSQGNQLPSQVKEKLVKYFEQPSKLFNEKVKVVDQARFTDAAVTQGYLLESFKHYFNIVKTVPSTSLPSLERELLEQVSICLK